MILRAQAEALLKLAEALEECERLDMTVEQDYEDASLCLGGVFHAPLSSVTGVSVRMAIAKLYPKSEAAE